MIILSRKLHHNERVKKNIFSIKYDSHTAKETHNCFVEEDLR